MSPSFDFDRLVDRHGTASLKWDRYQGRDIIPLWVADMDFASPPAVIKALQARVEHGIFGYTLPPAALEEAVQTILKEDHGWEIKREWLTWIPGLVCGLNVTSRAVGGPGDGVLTFTPVYPPFLTAPALAGRTLATAPLRLGGNRWEMDLAAAERAIGPTTRLLLLCNPQNPTGRVWSEVELLEVAALACRHDLIICSDEIHSGLVLDKNVRHIPMAALSPAIASRTITLNAPSKTYNIPGLGCSFAVIPDSGLRRQFREAMNGIVPHVNLLGFTAAQAAYQEGGQWRSELIDYLRGNAAMVQQAIDGMPGLHSVQVEATYLAWIDARQTGLENPAQFFEQAGVGLSDGGPFGMPGFLRLNFGCRRELLACALKRMHAALADHAGRQAESTSGMHEGDKGKIKKGIQP
ncbi:MAG: PatB family C-S lyase [Desulfocapsaceae bacterium]|nr:PatB family C-S lyase [Desulfocapsaceae bacterium]